MKFRYLRDPLFLCCAALYFTNRWILKPNFSWFFLHSYLNDVICIPFLVPPMLLVARWLRLRPDDSPPKTHEIYVPMIVWAVLYEIVLPNSTWRRLTHSDPYDVMAYVAGAIVASLIWDVTYRDSARSQSRWDERVAAR